MACTITLEMLGPAFAAVDPDIFAMWLETATAVVGAVATDDVWLNCAIDPCKAIRMLTQHMIATSPGSGAEQQVVKSESVADVSTAYSTADAASGLFAGSPYGQAYAQLLRALARCRAKRKALPFATRAGGCGC